MNLFLQEKQLILACGSELPDTESGFMPTDSAHIACLIVQLNVVSAGQIRNPKE